MAALFIYSITLKIVNRENLPKSLPFSILLGHMLQLQMAETDRIWNII